MNSTINGFYRYNDTFYTGTSTQPNILSIFIKKEKNTPPHHVFHAQAMANSFGCYFPIIGSFSGIARVVNAVKEIFKNLFSKKPIEIGSYSIAFKNLFRGLVETIPFTGFFLYSFDVVTIELYNNNILEEVSNKEKIAGVAMDGKVVLDVDLEHLKELFKSLNKDSEDYEERRFVVFKEFCLSYLKKQQRGSSSPKMIDAFAKLKATIDSKYLKHR